MDTEAELRSIVEEAVRDRVTPGGVIAVVTKGKGTELFSFGKHTYDAGAPEVTNDTMYDCASITKSVPTGLLALKLIEEGKLALDQKIAPIIPELQNQFRDLITVQHLLTYTVFVPLVFSELKTLTPTEAFMRIMITKMETGPGMKYWYTNYPYFLLGVVLERISGKRLDVLADEHLFVPLNMTRTTFHPEKFSLAEVAPTEIQEGKLVHGVVHDESARLFGGEGRAVGHAGIFSTAPDIANLVTMLLDDGVWNGVQIFTNESVRMMKTNAVEIPNAFVSLGWELNQPKWMGKNSNEHMFGKTGFTGTSVVVDRARGRGVVLLTNAVHPTRPLNRDDINKLRRRVADVVMGEK